MKEALVVLLSDTTMLELCSILIDRDRTGALALLGRRLKVRGRRALDGG
jgi:hypothetical protein